MDEGGLSGTLASDAEREYFCAILREACARGRLTPDELLLRVESALRARTREELSELVHDLPTPAGGPPPYPESEHDPSRRTLLCLVSR